MYNIITLGLIRKNYLLSYTGYPLFSADISTKALDSSFHKIIVNNDFDSFSKKWSEAEIQFLSSTFVNSNEVSNSPSPPPSFTSSKKGLSLILHGL